MGNSRIWIKKGIKNYIGFDIIALYKSASEEYYKELYSELGVTIDFKNLAIEKTEIIIDPKYRPEVSLKEKDFDIVFSQATFEHFENIEKTLKELSNVSKSGTVLISEIDFQTHTGIIKKVDPLNIYRYSQKLYSFFNFQGVPNRSRIFEFKDVLRVSGWSDIKVYPKIVLSDSDFNFVKNSLSSQFMSNDVQKEMNVLSAVLCATKN